MMHTSDSKRKLISNDSSEIVGFRQKKKQKVLSTDKNSEELVGHETKISLKPAKSKKGPKSHQNLSARKLDSKQSQQFVNLVSNSNDLEQNIDTNILSTNEDKNNRTLFVGNVGISIKKEQLLKAFRQYGKIESIRLRGVTPADPKTPKRLAAIKRTFHPKRTSLHCYVVFQCRDDAVKATELNGTKLNEHFIRVQLCDDNTELESTKAIFIGNLPFDTEENELWNTFEQYGKIISVRLVRNSETGMCIGIGFVNFDTSDAVELVLMADLITIRNRELRIQRYSKTKIKRSKGGNHPQQLKTPKPVKNKETKKPRSKFSDSSSDKNDKYQGSKFVQRKKKTKKNKTLRQNMKMVKKIAPR